MRCAYTWSRCLVLALLVASVAYTVVAETVSWSAPATIGVKKVTPLIGALPDGKVAVVSIKNDALLLGIYSTYGELLQEIEVDRPVTSIYHPRISMYETRDWKMHPNLDLDTANGKISIAYTTRDGSFFKQYASDGSLVIDKTTIAPISYYTVSVKIVVTPNGEIHTFFAQDGTTTPSYQRFSPAGTLIGSPISVPYSDGMWIKEVELVAHQDNTVSAGILVTHYTLGTLIFLRKIADGVLGPERRIQTSYYWCPGYLPRAAQCRVDGWSMAADRGNEYISAFVADYRGMPYGSIEWGWRPVLIKVAPQELRWWYVSNSGWSTRPLSDGIMNPNIIPRTQVVSANGEKWIFWSDRRNGDMGDLFVDKLGPNDEVLIDDVLIQTTGNEDFVAAAVDALGTPYVVYTNGFLQKEHAASTNVVSFFTKASTSTISVSGSPTPGSTVSIDFANPPTPNARYLAFASLTSGHTHLGNGIALPVLLDYLFFLSVTNPNVLFTNAQGTLDSAGAARIGMRIRPELLPGTTLYAGVVVYDGTGIKHVSFPLRTVVEEEIR